MGLGRRFFPETVLKQDTLLLYNPKECIEGKKRKVCPFFLRENSRPLSPWGPLNFLSTGLGIDSLNGLKILDIAFLWDRVMHRYLSSGQVET